MSVGDVKGARRNIKKMQRAGHAPQKRGKHLSVHAAIAREKLKAVRMAKVAAGKK